jgi:hypothetical protein
MPTLRSMFVLFWARVNGFRRSPYSLNRGHHVQALVLAVLRVPAFADGPWPQAVRSIMGLTGITNGTERIRAQRGEGFAAPYGRSARKVST